MQEAARAHGWDQYPRWQSDVCRGRRSARAQLRSAVLEGARLPRPVKVALQQGQRPGLRRFMLCPNKDNQSTTMKKLFCILASAALFAACEQKTETVNTPAASPAEKKTENNTTVVNPPATKEKTKETNTITNTTTSSPSATNPPRSSSSTTTTTVASPTPYA